MAESPVVGHISHGVAIIYDYIQIWQCAEHGAIKQRLASLPTTEQCALNSGAQYRLGYRVHD